MPGGDAIGLDRIPLRRGWPSTKNFPNFVIVVPDGRLAPADRGMIRSMQENKDTDCSDRAYDAREIVLSNGNAGKAIRGKDLEGPHPEVRDMWDLAEVFRAV